MRAALRAANLPSGAINQFAEVSWVAAKQPLTGSLQANGFILTHALVYLHEIWWGMDCAAPSTTCPLPWPCVQPHMHRAALSQMPTPAAPQADLLDDLKDHWTAAEHAAEKDFLLRRLQVRGARVGRARARRLRRRRGSRGGGRRGMRAAPGPPPNQYPSRRHLIPQPPLPRPRRPPGPRGALRCAGYAHVG